MTKEAFWDNWVIRTAVVWEDVEFIIKRTGIDFIDTGYKHLVEELLEMNKLLNLIALGTVDLKVIRKQTELFEKLFDFLKSLYIREDRLIRRYDLPGFENHQKGHKRILAILHGTIQDFKGGKMKTVNNFSALLLKSIILHIKEHDSETWGLNSWSKTIARTGRATDFDDVIRKMGIKSFDEEHQVFIDDVLSLRKEKSVNDVDKKLGELYLRANLHFKKEEEFIRKFHTGNLEPIYEDHKAVLGFILECRDKAVSGKLESVVDLSTRIVLKWLSHINETNYKSLSLATCSENIFRNAKCKDDISTLIHDTGMSVIDTKYHTVLETLFEMEDIMGEMVEEGGHIVRNAAVEGYFEKLQDEAKELFQVESALLKFDAGANNTRAEKHRSHLGEHNKFLQIMSYYHMNFNEDRIAISPSIKARLLSFLIAHHSNYDLSVYKENQ